MTTSQYKTPTVVADWADSRATHIAVATAIHAIGDNRRSAQAIWEDPTPAEWDHVVMAVENYVSTGVFPASDDGCYAWGEEEVHLAVAE